MLLPACLFQGCYVPGCPHVEDRPGPVVTSGWVKDAHKGHALWMYQMCWAGLKLVLALTVPESPLPPAFPLYRDQHTERAGVADGNMWL